MCSTSRLSTLLEWCRQNAIFIHKSIELADGYGISVVSTSDDPILHPTTLVCIPKQCILSTKSCSLAEAIPQIPYGHGAVLALSLALYSEILRGSASKWHGYLQSLPSCTVPIARMWGDPDAFDEDEQEDSLEAANIICGTEIDRQLRGEEGPTLIGETRGFYEDSAGPILEEHGFSSSLSGYLHSYSLVSSRAFMVDSYHGLSMVPIADAFNHTHENHVQLESEYDVCPTCGSLVECLHDRDDSLPPQTRFDHLTNDTVDMCTVRAIPPRAEVFNTYGSHLSNANLLAQYGFLLDAGETDVITFDSAISWGDTFGHLISQLEGAIDTSDLLFSPQHDQHALLVNSDGQVSLGLWIHAVLSAMRSRAPTEPERVRSLLFEVLALLGQVEARLADEDAAGEALGTQAEAPFLSEIARELGALFRARVVSTASGRSTAELVECLDSLTPSRVKTRLALEYLLSERAVLESCAATWEEVYGILGGSS